MSRNVNDPGSAWFGGGERSPATGLSRNVLLIATAVAASVSVLGLALFLHRCICHVRHRNRRRAASAAALPTTAADSAAAAPKGGLEPSAIAALPTAAYGKVDDAGCSECTICLGAAMQEGDAVRVLPACGHVFHVACVDTWLASSSSCPVCRAGVEPPPPPPTAAGWAQEKQDVEEAGTSAPARGLSASLRKILSGERPSARRPQGDHAVEMQDWERQQPQPQLQQ